MNVNIVFDNIIFPSGAQKLYLCVPFHLMLFFKVIFSFRIIHFFVCPTFHLGTFGELIINLDVFGIMSSKLKNFGGSLKVLDQTGMEFLKIRNNHIRVERIVTPFLTRNAVC